MAYIHLYFDGLFEEFSAGIRVHAPGPPPEQKRPEAGEGQLGPATSLTIPRLWAKRHCMDATLPLLDGNAID
jgi:hypothetical protein